VKFCCARSKYLVPASSGPPSITDSHQFSPSIRFAYPAQMYAWYMSAGLTLPISLKRRIDSSATQRACWILGYALESPASFHGRLPASTESCDPSGVPPGKSSRATYALPYARYVAASTSRSCAPFTKPACAC
jgi:hypothetical protein